MNIFFFLFSLAVELLILFAFRKADTNNRTLDRIRRYFDDKTKDLDEIVEEKKLELNDINKAMEGSEQNARELIKSFETSFNMVRKRDDEIKVLNSQLDTFRNAFNEMADASQKADKNLQLLKQESKYVEIVRRSIQNLTEQLGSIKENTESILADFNKKNDEAFEQLRLNLLNTVNLNMGSLQDGLEMAGKRLDTFNTQIEDLTARQELVSEKAVNSLSNTMNEKLDSFKTSIDTFGKGYMERLELLKDKNTAVESELFAALDKESRGRLEVVRGEIEKEFTDYQVSISEKIASVDALKQNIDALDSTLQKIKTGMEDVIKAVDNMGRVDDKLAAAEERLTRIDKIMEWLAKTETRLNDSVRKGEETIAVLGELVEKPVPISAPDTQMSQTERNETAKQLIQRGWTNEKIAETLGISEGEVDLIRDFYSSN